MDKSESLKTIAPALVSAQAEIEGAVKSKVNPHFKNSYADLAAVMDACKTALNKHGIAVLQTPAASDAKDVLVLDTVLMHTSGEFVSGRITMPLGKADPQGYGSAMTYARRYGLAAMTGVCPEDDDGEGAMGRGNGSGGARQQSKPQNTPTQSKPMPKDEAESIRFVEAWNAYVEAHTEGDMARSNEFRPKAVANAAAKLAKEGNTEDAAVYKLCLDTLKSGKWDSYIRKAITK